ncbi:hypothetical protein Adt_39929 [Abeliophyllum distichum]|uniref:Uncharacterized protein n=1 Tax=Abeliophyllum distichum TaxID=126358 RepID=A0ABD1Q6H2_9LAMI
MAMLQRATVPPLATENQPTEAILLPETTSSNNQTIPINLDILLSQKINEEIAQKKNRGRLIFIKKDPFTEELMSVPLPLIFKESTDEFNWISSAIELVKGQPHPSVKGLEMKHSIILPRETGSLMWTGHMKIYVTRHSE